MNISGITYFSFPDRYVITEFHCTTMDSIPPSAVNEEGWRMWEAAAAAVVAAAATPAAPELNRFAENVDM